MRQDQTLTAKQPHGSFLVFGPAMEPGLFWLTQAQAESFAQGVRIARDAPRDPDMYVAQVFAQTFAKGAQAAVPAWSPEALTMIAGQYTGPHQARVRYMAACLALGRPIEPQGGQDSGQGNGGGEKVPVPDPRPKGGAPAKVARTRDLRADRQALAIEGRQR